MITKKFLRNVKPGAHIEVGTLLAGVSKEKLLWVCCSHNRSKAGVEEWLFIVFYFGVRLARFRFSTSALDFNIKITEEEN